jgi:hypothetical protein
MQTVKKPPKRYIYEARRTGGKVQRIYVGPLHDPVVRVLIDAKSLGQATHQAAVDDAEQALDAYARIEPLIRLVASESSRLLRQHHERKRRERLRQQGGPEMSETAGRRPATVDLTRDEFDELVEQAEDGDETSLNELRCLLRRNAAAASLLGDVAAHVQQHLIDLLASESIVLREAVSQRMEQARQELLASGDSPLERMLVNQIIVSMLDVNIRHVEAERTEIGSTRRHTFERALDRAQERHLRAVTALQRLRSEC